MSFTKEAIWKESNARLRREKGGKAKRKECGLTQLTKAQVLDDIFMEDLVDEAKKRAEKNTAAKANRKAKALAAAAAMLED